MSRHITGASAGTSPAAEPILGSWLAGGLVLAVLTTAVVKGGGALIGGAVLIAVIWLFARLRAAAPSAESTCDLIGAQLGERAATMVAVFQLCAYLSIASVLAARLGVAVLARLTNDPEVILNSWWPAMWAALVALLAGALVYVLSSRVVAAVCLVVAGVATLISFYLALAVLASVYAGPSAEQIARMYDEPDAIWVAPAATSGLGTVSAVVVLAIAVLGAELITVANSGLRSVARPMGTALALTMAIAALVWAGAYFAVGSGFTSSPLGFSTAVIQHFGDAGRKLLTAFWFCSTIAALLAMLWALYGVGSRVGQRLESRVRLSARDVVALVLVPAAAVAAAMAAQQARVWVIATAVPAILLVAVYVCAAFANARLPRWVEVSWWVKLAMVIVLAVVVFIPLWASDFGPTGYVPILVAGGVAAAAAVLAWYAPRSIGMHIGAAPSHNDRASEIADPPLGQ